MKILVDSIQMLVVAAMIYPMFYLWDINKVDQFCRDIETGISQQTFLQIADEQAIKIIGESNGKGKWNSSAVTWSPFTSYSCKVRGYGGVVSNAWIENV